MSPREGSEHFRNRQEAHLSMLKLLLVVGILAVPGYYTWDLRREIPQPNGTLAPAKPRQMNMRDGQAQFYKGYRLIPLARFSMAARVLSHERYHFGRAADLAPIDLALGWGPMSANGVLDKIDIFQNGRFYFWNASKLPIPSGEISRYSANMHMIPGSATIADELKRVRTGHVVEFSGYLVAVDAADGWVWRSSLSRMDRGEGSCELVYVSHFRIRET